MVSRVLVVRAVRLSECESSTAHDNFLKKAAQLLLHWVCSYKSIFLMEQRYSGFQY
eukprot:m.882819 g.882819  ORF g.882819 m.882819 type:complete len:56 (-) comp23598_c0_seq3:2879-3046(-)